MTSGDAGAASAWGAGDAMGRSLLEEALLLLLVVVELVRHDLRPDGERAAHDLGVEAVGDADGDDLRVGLLVARLVVREEVDAAGALGEGRFGRLGDRLAVGAARGRGVVAEGGVGEAAHALGLV